MSGDERGAQMTFALDEMDGIEGNPLLGSMKMVAQTVNVIRARMAGTDLGTVSVSAASGGRTRRGVLLCRRASSGCASCCVPAPRGRRRDRRGPQGEDLGRRRRCRQANSPGTLLEEATGWRGPGKAEHSDRDWGSKYNNQPSALAAASISRVEKGGSASREERASKQSGWEGNMGSREQ
ncbi:hypothetical protein THAOC_31167 [Thalassiosira oceanica]|uniref:Uncharacterized protein n=1 Tax=Thalassiosira oceanica TaxID=159749 RepID=K0R8P1_THAOC|nr:hypothetical protein THAOC_31167 [Thalassiosira oceanica]|eukprot:EJK49908.1 hypothetical protein THAOC_31167 [Thalassiosira oceanica]